MLKKLLGNALAFLYLNNLLITFLGPQNRTLQPVRGEGYEPAYKSKANAETHPRLGQEVVAVF